MTAQLTQAELTAARLFFDVSVQAAFALEDPNPRFAAAFNRKDMIGYKGASSLKEVAHKIYQAEIDGEAAVALETNPPNSPALSRVLAKGCRHDELIGFLKDGLSKVDYFSTVELGALQKTDPSAGHPDDKSLAFRLDVAERFNAQHNVLIVIAWRTMDSGQDEIEMSAWPIGKPVPEPADTASQTA